MTHAPEDDQGGREQQAAQESRAVPEHSVV
jgi:hypothetical protein